MEGTFQVETNSYRYLKHKGALPTINAQMIRVIETFGWATWSDEGLWFASSKYHIRPIIAYLWSI